MRVGYYPASLRNPRGFAPARGRIDTDIAIVGGGFAGLNTALSLTERGHRDVLLLESEEVGFGASGRNGGFVFAGYSLGEESLLGKLGKASARQLYQRTVAAVDKIRQRAGQYQIDCDLVDEGVLLANWFRDPGILRRRQQLLEDKFGASLAWVDREHMQTMLPGTRYSDGLLEPNAFHLHPLAYALGLATAAERQGAAIHEHSRVLAMRRDKAGWRLTTDGAEIHARRVVLACGGYLAGLAPRVDRAVLPIGTCVMVTEPLGARLAECMRTRSAVYDTRFAFDYYRPLADTRLLWGGRIYTRRPDQATVRRWLRRDLARVFPQLAEVQIDYAWSGLMSYARHQMPQIGTGGDGLWWAQAFGGHGLAPTTVAGELLGAALAEGDSAWKEFSRFGLARSWRPFGYLAAQASYWRLQTADVLKGLRET